MFGHPAKVELDVVVEDGHVIVVEIKSSSDLANMYLFDRKVAMPSSFSLPCHDLLACEMRRLSFALDLQP